MSVDHRQIPALASAAPQRHSGWVLTTVGDYVLEQELGRGSYGVVYRAVRQGTRDPVALKLLDPRRAGPEAALRFRREAESAQRSAKHPGIVGVLDVGSAGRFLYYAMEYVPGETLAAHLQRGALGPAATAELVAQLAEALAVAHAEGVVHRDLKPSNVILETESGRARITDFGLAHDSARERLTRTGDTLGTPVFMAPEQISGERVSPKVDVYALGMILYQALLGRHPFAGLALWQLPRAIEQGPGPLPSEVPGPLRTICAQAIAHDPGDRPSAQELAGRLRQAGRTRPAAGVSVLWVAVGLLLLALTMAGSILLGRGGPESEARRPQAGSSPQAKDSLLPKELALPESLQPAPLSPAAPEDPEAAILAEARIAYRLARFQEARALAVALAARVGGDLRGEALYLAAQSRYRGGDLQGAVAELRELHQEQPQRLWGLTGGASAARLSGAYEEAERLARGALELAPELPAAHMALAISFKHRGFVELAIEHYERAQRAAPDHFRPLWALAVSYRESGRTRDALRTLSELRALTEPRPYYSALGYQAELLQELGHPGGAEALYDRALELRPDDLNTRHRRALLRLQRGDRAAARADVERILQAAPRARAQLDARLRALLDSAR